MPNEVQLSRLFHITSEFVSRAQRQTSRRTRQHSPGRLSDRAGQPPRHVSLFILLPCQFLNFAVSSWAFSPSERRSASAKVPVGLDVLKGKVNQRHSKGTVFLEEYSSRHSLHLPYGFRKKPWFLLSHQKEKPTRWFSIGDCRIFISLSCSPAISFLS